jgi:hypothetical protein
MPGPEVADAIARKALTLEPPRFDFVPGETIAIRAHPAAKTSARCSCARALWLHLATAGRFVQCMWHYEDLPSIATIMGGRAASVDHGRQRTLDQDLGNPPAGVG